MASFIGETRLRELLLDVVRTHRQGVASVSIAYAVSNTSTCNWKVESFDRGSADYDAAREAIRRVVAVNREHWVMVPDRDWRDGQIVGQERFYERKWDGLSASGFSQQGPQESNPPARDSMLCKIRSGVQRAARRWPVARR